jgi:ankyrin repeat protein
MKWLALLMCATALMQNPALNEEMLAAARKGDIDAVKSLLEKGASLEATSRYGQTPLFFAARNGHEELVKFLLAKGANPNVSDTFYKISLISAAADKGNTGVVKLLLEAGSDSAGAALEIAVGRGYGEMTAMILASAKLTAAELTSALTTAERTRRAEIVDMLKKAGAQPEPKPTAQVSEDKLKLYAGTYRGEPIGEVIVTFKEGKLFLSVQGQSLELGAYDDTTFVPLAQPGVKFKFTFEGDRVNSMILIQGAQSLVLKRMEAK